MRRGGVKSFVDDLAFGLGAVRSRAATTLRSVETQPASGGFAMPPRRGEPPYYQLAESKVSTVGEYDASKFKTLSKLG